MPKTEIERVHIVVQGRVQGVGFRFFTQSAAEELDLTGWVRNRADGSVEAEAEGPRKALEAWISRLRRGPGLSLVQDVEVSWHPSAARHISFTIVD